MAENKIKWIQVMSGCLSAFVREQSDADFPVVDYEVRADSTGGPDDLRVWFICRSKAEKDRFMNTERPRSFSLFKKKMIAGGFPDSAVASVEISVTSREEMEKAGGGSSFFR